MKKQRIKVLIVEDEVILLKNMNKKISSIFPEFEIVGEAFDGKSALEMVQCTHPDIVFTDIRMPIMDGLELSKILRERYPEIFTVIVSGYDDFEYARTALRHSVSNYLLKPLQYNALKDTLSSLKKSIEEKQNTDIHMLLDAKLNEIPQSGIPEYEAAALKGCTFSMFLICLGNLHMNHKANIWTSNSSPTFETLPWNSILKNSAFTFSDFWVFPRKEENLRLLLIEEPFAPPQDMAAFLHRSLVKHVPHRMINLCCCKESIPYALLDTTAKALHKELFSSLVIGHSAVFSSPAPLPDMPPAVLPTSSVHYLQTLISSNNTAEFEKTFRRLFYEWEVNQYPQQWVDKVLMQVIQILQQNLIFSEETYGQMCGHIFTILETEPTLSNAGSKIIPELLYWTFFSNATPSEIETVIEELDAHIRSHYTEAINLATLAEKYHFNHSYLTKTFKKLKGESPLKLINMLRIEDAKNLLLNPDLTIKEISEMLGFSDQHYFSRIFKDFTGGTPKEYRGGNTT